MSELRTPPTKPDPKFWDNEARKLMLISYGTFRSCINPRYKPLGIGAVGLAHLGFRVPSRVSKIRSSKCPITKQFGRLLVNACRRMKE